MSEEGCQRESSRDGSDTYPHHHQMCTPLSSLSHHPSKNYNHSTGHRWTFGMGLLILVIISTISTSSMVMCVPLGHQNGGGDGSSSESTHRNGLMIPNSRGWGLQRNENQLESAAPYSLLSKGQIYLPSLLKNGPVKAAAAALASSTDYSSDAASSEGDSAIKEDQQQSTHHGPSNYHLQQFHREQNSEGSPFKHSVHIQKLLSQQQEDFPLTNGKGIDEEEDDNPTTPTGLNDYDDTSSNTQGQSEWETVIDPHLYVLTEWDSPPYQEQFPLLQQQRKRRNSGTGPSLSIVNPLDVLRQRLLLEIARRRMRQSHNQIIANEEILRKIGRRRR